MKGAHLVSSDCMSLCKWFLALCNQDSNKQEENVEEAYFEEIGYRFLSRVSIYHVEKAYSSKILNYIEEVLSKHNWIDDTGVHDIS